MVKFKFHDSLDKVAVIGPRVKDYSQVDEAIARLRRQGLRIGTFVTRGGKTGTDAHVRRYATAHKLKLTEIRSDYRKFGCGSAMVRDRIIVEQSGCVLAFVGIQGTHAKGTESVVAYARSKGVPVFWEVV